jgi:hypothetical protein
MDEPRRDVAAAAGVGGAMRGVDVSVVDVVPLDADGDRVERRGIDVHVHI